MIELYTGISYKKEDCLGAWTSLCLIKKNESVKILSGNVIHYPSNRLSYSAERLELLAILESLLSFKSEKTIAIYTDSKYIFEAISSQKFKEWVVNEDKNIKELDLWTLYYNLDKVHSVAVNLLTSNPILIKESINSILSEELELAREHKKNTGETQCVKRTILDFKELETYSEIIEKEVKKNEDLILEDLFVGNPNPFDKENVESYERQKSSIVSNEKLKYDYSKTDNSTFRKDLLPIENNHSQRSIAPNRNKKRSSKSKAKGYYAVAKGRTVGVCTSWDECKKRTEKFKGAVFKKFNTEEEALNFIKANK